MRHLALATLGTAILALSACGGSSGSGTAPSTTSMPPPPAPATQITVVGVVEGSGTGLTLNQTPLDLQGARFTLNGQPADPSTLKPGMPITGTAKAQAGTLKLDQVETHSEIEGQLESVDHDTLRILGQTVLVTPRTKLADDRGGGNEDQLHLEDLHARDDLRIFGLKSASSILEATRVERRQDRPGQTEVKVRGKVQGLDSASSSFSLNGTRVEFGHAQVIGVLAEAADVEVQGILAAGTIAANRIVVEAGQVDPPQSEVELRGAISELNPTAKTFRLLAFTIDFSMASIQGTLLDGRWAQVHAAPVPGQPADRLSASRVKVEDDVPPAVGEELSGIVDALDPANRIVAVGGTSFWMDDQTSLLLKGQPAPAGSLHLGSQVEIHFDAMRKNAAGLAYAFRIQIQEAPENEGIESQVEGRIASFDPSMMQFTLGGFIVKTTTATVYHQKGGSDLSAATFWGSNRNGAKAEAVGSLAGTTLTATRIELK